MSDSVWLVRHASTPWSGRRWCGRTDLPLTAIGEQEAERLATRLAEGLPNDVELVSSPLRRARATASSIAEALQQDYRIDEALREVDFGRAEGLSWPELEASLPDLARALVAGHAEVDWPGGDAVDVTRERARAIWRGVEGTGASCVVLVSHGGTIGALLAASGLVGTPMVPPASATPLRRVDGRWTVTGPVVTS